MTLMPGFRNDVVEERLRAGGGAGISPGAALALHACPLILGDSSLDNFAGAGDRAWRRNKIELNPLGGDGMGQE
jgi:hypothetical protein